MSTGLVQIDSDTKNDESVVAEADRLMYENKRHSKVHH